MGTEFINDSWKQAVKCLNDLVTRYPGLAECRESINKAFFLLKRTFTSEGKLMICGNGGSATDAVHISGELQKGFLKKRPLPPGLKGRLRQISREDSAWIDQLQGGLPVVPLTTNYGLITAVCNDQNPSLIFAQQILSIGKPNDSLLAISTSGNSDNVIKGALVARALGITIIGLTGASESRLKEIADLTIQVPATSTYLIQELHLPVYHALCAMLEAEFFT